MSAMARHTVLSGIRATGRIHLGNYLGAVKGMLELQANPEYDTLYMVADVHTITTPFSPSELGGNRREIIIDYLACGLDPEKSILFLQAMVPEHLELSFLLSSVMTIARMQHLPTFKDKVKQYPEAATMALLNYPLLMAADILIYNATAVPVGIDQEPHLEVAREVARKMNEKYALNFPEPRRFVTTGEYVPSLLGEGKMSKSVDGSFIALSDSFDMILQRLKAAPTDSGHGVSIPKSGGVANLLQLVSLFQGDAQRKVYESEYLDKGIRYGALKESLAQAIANELAPIQEKRATLEKDVDYVDSVIREGAQKARELAGKTVKEVKNAMGLGNI